MGRPVEVAPVFESVDFRAAAFAIGNRVYARPIIERCVPETFPDTVREECAWWIEHIGEPAYGQPFTHGMTDEFNAAMIEALGKAFTVEGYDE